LEAQDLVFPIFIAFIGLVGGAFIVCFSDSLRQSGAFLPVGIGWIVSMFVLMIVGTALEDYSSSGGI